MMILGIIQARMNSSRLPGKVLKELHGIPMLLIMMDRVLESKKLTHVLIATSREKTDDPIEEFCRRHNQPPQGGVARRGSQARSAHPLSRLVAGQQG